MEGVFHPQSVRLAESPDVLTAGPAKYVLSPGLSETRIPRLFEMSRKSADVGVRVGEEGRG